MSDTPKEASIMKDYCPKCGSERMGGIWTCWYECGTLQNSDGSLSRNDNCIKLERSKAHIDEKSGNV